MCLVALAWQVDPLNPLVLLANRDEFFARPSAPMAAWQEHPEIIAGRDLQAGGTWLGFNRVNRRLAVITNVREPGAVGGNPSRSRGFLIPDFLLGASRAIPFADRLMKDAAVQYDGYNLLLFDGDQAVCVGNRAGVERLAPGVHGLSNARLNTPWPKVERVKAGLASGLEQGGDVEPLEELFRHDTQVADEELPSTGVPIDWERKLSAVYIDGDVAYGTRALTSVKIPASGPVRLREWSRSSVEDDWNLVELQT